MANLDYELRDDGILYELEDGTRVKVQGKGVRKVTVSFQRGEQILPPETGNLGGSTFREKVVKLAGEWFGEVNGLAEELGVIALMFEDHLKEREEAAVEYDSETNVPELMGTFYRISEDSGFVSSAPRVARSPYRSPTLPPGWKRRSSGTTALRRRESTRSRGALETSPCRPLTCQSPTSIA